MVDTSMDDASNRSNDSDRDRGFGNNMRDSLTLGTKLLAVLIIVSVLSLGLIGCTFFFIYMCFKYPQSATTLLPSLIPAGLSSVAILYGKKLLSRLTDKNDSKLIAKDSD